VLPESAYGAWLDRGLDDPAAAAAIAARRLPPEAFAHWPVRLLVNDAGRDGPELIEPLASAA
jgi:putative SOS response-associated peptidase YedK